jgi:hypothetical protein
MRVARDLGEGDDAMTDHPPTLSLTSITIGTSMPHDLATFYATLLRWEITADEPPGEDEPANAGWAQVKPPAGVTGPTLNFEFERQFQAPVWPAEPGGQNATQHLDIHVDDLETAVAWAESCGATQMAFQPQDDVRVMRDPDGHPF